MNILVTGSNGQLGKEIKDQAPETGFNFIFHDIDTLDITNSNELYNFFNETPVDLIINCAAYTAVDKAEEDEKHANLINHTGVRDLSLITRHKGIKLIHISTDYVFDGNGSKPYQEDDAPKPASVYGFTKLKGEYEVLNNKDAIIIRTSWLYSCYGNNFVKTILRLAKERGELNVIYDQIGSPTYAKDLASAILSIILQYDKNPTSYKAGIYHYANEGVCSWFDFAHEIISMAKLPCKINPIETKDYPTAAPRPHYSVLNKTKIKDTFGITIPYWKDSLAACLNKLNQ